MAEGIISVHDIESLINRFKFLPKEMKDKLIYLMFNEIRNINSNMAEAILKNMYNVFTIAARFNNDSVFRNGRIIFRDDRGLIFESIMGPYQIAKNISLFSGCIISHDDNSTYISLNYSELSNPEINCKVNFDKIIKDAITPPEISIIINLDFYPEMIDDIIGKFK